ncbi:MAG: DUF6152 family protein [Rubrivivax sp.]
MRRRTLIAAAPLLLFLPRVWAHHGWSSFDQSRPIYLEGTAAKVMWRNPHAEIELELAPDLKVPPDLASRKPPAQTAPVEGVALLRTAQVPTRKDKRWEIELAPLSRMSAWKVPEIQIGDRLALVGFTTQAEQGEPVLRVEYLLYKDGVYGLRSSPA